MRTSVRFGVKAVQERFGEKWNQIAVAVKGLGTDDYNVGVFPRLLSSCSVWRSLTMLSAPLCRGGGIASAAQEDDKPNPLEAKLSEVKTTVEERLGWTRASRWAEWSQIAAAVQAEDLDLCLILYQQL